MKVTDGTSAPARIGAVVRSMARRPFASLPSRIITSVFAAALCTSVAVTIIATQSTEAFFQAKIEERLPDLLARTADRIDFWYAQRELDIETFGRSDTVAESLAGSGSSLSREEARKYLAYVREGFPQYRALFVLDATGSQRVWVGEEPELPASLLERLVRPEDSSRGRVFRAGDGLVQFISSPIRGRDASIGSLHAMIDIDSLEALLLDEGREGSVRVMLVGEGGEVVAHSGGSAARGSQPPELPAVDGHVSDYLDERGERVVGSARELSGFGWTLVVEEPYEVAFAPIVSVRRRLTAINVCVVLGFALLAFLIARSIVQPIHALSESARRIAQGETDVELPAAAGQDEIGVLSRALSEMVARLKRNQLELERSQEEIEEANTQLVLKNEELRRGNEVLEQLSFTDGLTRLHNHRYFQDRLRMEAKRADRTREPLSLLLLDIDDFKALNDRFGHAVGDEVLRRVAQELNDSVREMDLPARYGGEEFAVLAPRTGGEGANALAEKLRGAVSAMHFTAEGVEDARDISVTVSIGVALYEGDEKHFFNDADRALYRAKAAGKDCVVSAIESA